MASILNVDQINEATTGGGVQIPGHVVQIVTSTTSTEVTNNTTSEVATGLSALITPSSSSNKVFALVTLPIQRGSNGGNIEVDYYLKRGSTVIATGKSMVNVNAIVQLKDEVSISKLDSPSTTSATTYSVTFKETTQTNRYGATMVCAANATATLTLMEIAQ
tara:strand:+ start:1995 stop:2480 length:486 start_codon:yes stop_codon:yes gene_type:complete